MGSNIESSTLKKKRGRKPKELETKETKETEEIKETKKRGRKPKELETKETKETKETEEIKETKKRGRKPKEIKIKEETKSHVRKSNKLNEIEIVKQEIESVKEEEVKEKVKEKVPNKRGRKPKILAIEHKDTIKKDSTQKDSKKKDSTKNESTKKDSTKTDKYRPITSRIKNEVWSTFTSKPSSHADLKNIFLGDEPTQSYIKIKDKLKKELDKKTAI